MTRSREEFESAVRSFQRIANCSREYAEKKIRESDEYRDVGRVIEIDPIADGALEKIEETETDKLAIAAGFRVTRISHPGPTKQTPGISDRIYMRAARYIDCPTCIGTDRVCSKCAPTGKRLAHPAYLVWMELKSEEKYARADHGQSEDQKEFQKMIESLEGAAGEYVLGPRRLFIEWLERKGVARMVAGTLEIL